MNKKDRMTMALERGYKYEPTTGKIFGARGMELTNHDDDGYLVFGIRVDGKDYRISGHHFAWFCHYGTEVYMIDHINRDRSDNRICNLREADHKLNNENSKSVGVYRHKNSDGYWSRITVNKKKVYLGSYRTFDEARAAYVKAKKELHPAWHSTYDIPQCSPETGRR